MDVYKGISASGGIAVGESFCIPKNVKQSIEKRTISPEQLEPGWIAFETAQVQVADYFSSLIDAANAEQSAIFQTYILMLNDPEFVSQIKQSYERDLICIEAVVDEKSSEAANILMMSGDDYLMQRAADIVDVFSKVLDILTGKKAFSFADIPPGAIVFAHDIAPSDAGMLAKYSVKALVTEEGGQSSHLSIIARSYGIPAIFGVKNADTLLLNGTPVIADAQNEGKSADIFVNPDEKTRHLYEEKSAMIFENQKKLDFFIDKPAQTKDGFPVQIFANIGSVEEAEQALKHGAAGIGLFRTEFLFMGETSENAHEDAQYKIYSDVLKIMQDKPVIIRTLDAGGDKEITIPLLQRDKEPNPLLGCRAVRLCLAETSVLKTQLRALLRAGVYGNLKIMIPLITHVEQVVQVKTILEEAKKELASENTAFKDDIDFGIMIETPAAAVIADVLAPHVDFFSIGSNDLTQYTLCVDRENMLVSDLFDELHPAVLRLIQMTIDGAKKHSVAVSVCGEMAGRTTSMFELLSCGIDTFSMGIRNIAYAKQALAQCTLKDIQDKKWKT